MTRAPHGILATGGAALVLCLSGVLLLLPPAQGAPVSPASPSGGQLRFVRAGETHAFLLGGVLSSSSAQPPALAARAYLASRPEPLAGVAPDAFGAPKIMVLPGRAGTLISFEQRFAGLPVVGRKVTLRLDADQRVRWILSSARPLSEDLDTVPAISAKGAARLVVAGPARHQHLRSLDPRQVELVVWGPPLREARLAWRVLVPRNLLLLETLRVYVDAETGQILSVENLARDLHQANVFDENPVATPTITQVTLPLATEPPAAQLVGDDIVVENCIDQHNCMTLDTEYGQYRVHMCDMVPTVTADETTGDFLQYVRPESDTAPEDAFAEVQMYYHTTKAYAAFRSWGFDQLDAHPLQALVNFRMPTLDASSLCSGPTNDGELQPFDNAAFMPAGSLYSFPAEDMIIFGQGTGGDFAYDGDVVYHEFTHAVMFTATTLGSVSPDRYGLDTTTGGMHEGYADFFSCAITGDAETGEYAGEALTGGAIRDLENSSRCPDDLVGETHYDGEIWGAALWDVRQELIAAGHPESQINLAFFTALSSLSDFDTFDTAQAATTAAVATELGADAASLAQASFEARGVNGCSNRIIDVVGDFVKDVLYLYGTDVIGLDLIPGPVQFRLALTRNARSISVNIGRSTSQAYTIIPEDGVFRFLVKKDEPISWTWTTLADHDATTQCTVVLPADGGSGSCTIDGEFLAGTYYLQLATAGPSFALGDLSFATAPLVPSFDAGVPDAGQVGDGGAGGDAGTDDGDDGGCGCLVGAAGTGGAGWLAIIGLLLATLVACRRGRNRRHVRG